MTEIVPNLNGHYRKSIYIERFKVTVMNRRVLTLKVERKRKQTIYNTLIYRQTVCEWTVIYK